LTRVLDVLLQNLELGAPGVIARGELAQLRHDDIGRVRHHRPRRPTFGSARRLTAAGFPEHSNRLINLVYAPVRLL